VTRRTDGVKFGVVLPLGDSFQQISAHLVLDEGDQKVNFLCNFGI